MKIAVVSDDSKTIASHFGQAAGFIIFEIEDGRILKREFRANSFTHHHLGGAVNQPHEHQPHSHAGILTALEDCEAVISCGMGQRMFVDFQSVGKEIFITDVSDAEMAVQKYLKGELPNYPDRGCRHHH